MSKRQREQSVTPVPATILKQVYTITQITCDAPYLPDDKYIENVRIISAFYNYTAANESICKKQVKQFTGFMNHDFNSRMIKPGNEGAVTEIITQCFVNPQRPYVFLTTSDSATAESNYVKLLGLLIPGSVRSKVVTFELGNTFIREYINNQVRENGSIFKAYAVKNTRYNCRDIEKSGTYGARIHSFGVCQIFLTFDEMSHYVKEQSEKFLNGFMSGVYRFTRPNEERDKKLEPIIKKFFKHTPYGTVLHHPDFATERMHSESVFDITLQVVRCFDDETLETGPCVSVFDSYDIINVKC
jgi:hypothetical protein